MNIFRRNLRVHDIRNNANNDIHFFQHKRWQLVTILEQLSGYWPFQSKHKQYPLQVYHLLVLLSIFSAIGNTIKDYKGVNADMVVECILLMLFMFVLMIKLTCPWIFQRSRQKVYEKIAEQFRTITDPEEAAVLKKVADQGFIYTAVYLFMISIIIGIFDSLPVLNSFYNYFFVDGELDLQLPIPMNYGFDHKKYWYVLTMDYLLFVYSGILVEFAHDLPFILQARHVQALFEVVRMRLIKASEFVDNNENEATGDEAVDESYSKISSAIDLHSECLEIVEMIEETYTVNWFLILLISTGGFGGGLYAVSTKLHQPLELLRYSLLYMLCIMHFQVVFSQGQVIIDSSEKVSEACYECKWYGLPKKSCKLLSTMMMRSSTPCLLTGAKLFPLSMESFSKMLKAGLSYYTVFQT